MRTLILIWLLGFGWTVGYETCARFRGLRPARGWAYDALFALGATFWPLLAMGVIINELADRAARAERDR